MNRVANCALRFAIRAPVHRRELNCVVLLLQPKLEAGWWGKRRAISVGWPFEI
jgi:hypothetical protein